MMAEALAVVGVIASILDLVKSTKGIIDRLNEYREVAEELPKALRHVDVELPLLSDTLQRTRASIENGAIHNTNALEPVIKGCQKQIESLNPVLAKLIPLKDDSIKERIRKGLSSIYHEGEVERITTNIRHYVQTLTYYHAANSALKLVKGKANPV
jgi:folylpolyglutamate synthase/dihydropteroate synthase